MPLTRDQCRTLLSELFESESDCADRLLVLLTRETQALEERDAENIEVLVAAKHTLMAEFEGLEQRRRQILAQAGFTDDQVDLCISRCDRSGQLQQRWERLLGQIRACQHQNRRIGATVEISRRYTQQALGVLRGQSPQADIYTAKGASNSPFAASRTLAKV